MTIEVDEYGRPILNWSPGGEFLVSKPDDSGYEYARTYKWDKLLSYFESNPSVINTTRNFGYSGFTALHHAAHGGAPVEVVKGLIELGAWRTVRNARNERPLEVAHRRGHKHLFRVLEPKLYHQAQAEDLIRIRANFHAVIIGRAATCFVNNNIRLPQVEFLLEFEEASCWFGVPGMYGGFKFWFEFDPSLRLRSESWVRVVEGSIEYHEFTPKGYTRMNSSFDEVASMCTYSV